MFSIKNLSCPIKRFLFKLKFHLTLVITFFIDSTLAYSLSDIFPPEKVAILGDGINMGNSAHPEITFNFDEIWQLINNQKIIDTRKEEARVVSELKINSQKLGRPVNLWQSSREYRGSLDWIFQHLIKSMNLLYLDFPEFSWGFMTARALGVPADKIYIAAQHNTNISNLPRQLDKLFDYFEDSAPDTFFIFLSDAELCENHPSLLSSTKTYSSKLKQALEYLVVNIKKPESYNKKTQVILLSHFGISQILSNPKIQAKEVQAHGELVSCQELIHRNFQPTDQKKLSKLPPESLYLSQIFPPNPSQRCPTLFGQQNIAQTEIGFFANFNQKEKTNKINLSIEKQTSEIAGKIRTHRSSMENVSKQLNEWKKAKEKQIQFFYLNANDKIQFEAKDISNDCHHLAIDGHLKITKSILQKLL